MTPHHQQSGVSLISMLVGLLVSMIAVLGIMALFNTTLHSNARSSQDARLTGERATGMLIAHMELQGAGFGIPNAAPGTHLRLLSDATLAWSNDGSTAKLSGTAQDISSGERSGNALVWSLAEDLSTRHCVGLYAPSTADRGLYLLRSQTCNDANANLDWHVQPLVVDFQDQPFRRIQDFTFVVRHHDCQGLGITGEGHLEVTLNTKHSTGAAQSDNDAIDLSSTTCLLNFPQ